MKKEMLQLKKNLLILGIATTGLSLVGCSQPQEESKQTEEKVEKYNHIMERVKKYNPQDNYDVIMNTNYDIIMNTNPNELTKIFEPYKHYVSVRVLESLDRTHGFNSIYDNYISRTINNIPEGYEVYTIYPINSGSGTNGYIVWFVNNQTVDVDLSYNNVDKMLGYFTFGKVKEKVKTK